MTTADKINAVLVFITAVYAWLTYKILKANQRTVAAMQEQTESMSRPYITATITLEPDSPVFYLRIQNTGKTSATDLSLSISRDFYKFGEVTDDHNLARLSLFNRAIDSFPPGSEVVVSLAQGFVVFGFPEDNPTCPHSFTISASYSFGLKRVTEHINIDLRPYLHTDVPQDALIRKMKDLTTALGKIEKAIVAGASNRT